MPKRAHIIPMEMPNRRFPTPPPFVFHPELFPDLSKNNPEPKNFELRTTNKNMRRKDPIRASVVPGSAFKMHASMTPQVFATHQSMYAFKNEPHAAKLNTFQNEVHSKLTKYILPNYD